MIREAGQLQVGKHETGSGTGASRNQRSGASDTHTSTQVPKGPQLQQMMVGRDVDDLIMEEREQDILRLNRDVALVNEMFKYGTGHIYSYHSSFADP